ncbi:MAG: tetratricopeptide repeat protein [Deltaproteobacteria bacterium]|nr:tetratricopeptide repeat protein [Deltaproteobacteria bacterium]
MKTVNSACPEPPELDRVFSEGADEAVEDHLRRCPRCAAEWAEIKKLAAAGRDMPYSPLSEDRREILRASIVARVSAPPRKSLAGPRAAVWAAAAAVLVLVAAAVIARFGFESRGSGAAARNSAANATVFPGKDASFTRLGSSTDGIIRLAEGTITVEVAALAKGERFRVVTGDAEVEVRGTLFDVTAVSDRLDSVRVIRGRVEVRPAGRTATVLDHGQRWNTAALSRSAQAIVEDGADQDQEDEEVPEASDVIEAAAGTPLTAAQNGTGPGASQPQVRVSMQSNTVEAAFEKGWQALSSGDPGRASGLFGLAASAAGSDPLAEDASYWMAVSLGRAAEKAKARAAFFSFLNRYPDSVRAGEASAMLGWLLFEAGDLDGAAGRFNDAAGDKVQRVRESARAGLEAVAKARGGP